MHYSVVQVCFASERLPYYYQFIFRTASKCNYSRHSFDSSFICWNRKKVYKM